MLLFCFRFFSHSIENRPRCCMILYECFVRSALPNRFSLRLSDEISCLKQILDTEICFWCVCWVKLLLSILIWFQFGHVHTENSREKVTPPCNRLGVSNDDGLETRRWLGDDGESGCPGRRASKSASAATTGWRLRATMGQLRRKP